MNGIKEGSGASALAETGSSPAGQAPAGLDASRVDPARERTEQSLRDKYRFLLGERGAPTAFARDHGLCDETVISFVNGRRPPADALLEAMGYRREYRYFPCSCFACTRRRTALDPGTMMFGVSVEMQRMFLCVMCGNKRCPHAADHRHDCTGSNEPRQPGSLYEDAPSFRDSDGTRSAETQAPAHQGCQARADRHRQGARQ